MDSSHPSSPRPPARCRTGTDLRGHRWNRHSLATAAPAVATAWRKRKPRVQKSPVTHCLSNNWSPTTRSERGPIPTNFPPRNSAQFLLSRTAWRPVNRDTTCPESRIRRPAGSRRTRTATSEERKTGVPSTPSLVPHTQPVVDLLRNPRSGTNTDRNWPRKSVRVDQVVELRLPDRDTKQHVLPANHLNTTRGVVQRPTFQLRRPERQLHRGSQAHHGGARFYTRAEPCIYQNVRPSTNPWTERRRVRELALSTKEINLSSGERRVVQWNACIAIARCSLQFEIAGCMKRGGSGGSAGGTDLIDHRVDARLEATELQRRRQSFVASPTASQEARPSHLIVRAQGIQWG